MDGVWRVSTGVGACLPACQPTPKPRSSPPPTRHDRVKLQAALEEARAQTRKLEGLNSVRSHAIHNTQPSLCIHPSIARVCCIMQHPFRGMHETQSTCVCVFACLLHPSPPPFRACDFDILFVRCFSLGVLPLNPQRCMRRRAWSIYRTWAGSSRGWRGTASAPTWCGRRCTTRSSS